MPVEVPIVPGAVGLFDQVPPALAFVSVVVWPVHTLSVPPIAPGSVFTVTVTMDAQPVAPIV